MKISFQQVKVAYDISKMVYDSVISRQEGIDRLEKTGMNSGSAFIYLLVYKSLIEGQQFKRTLSAESFDYFLGKILEDFGKDQLIIVLEALRLHIEYLENFRNYKMGRARCVYEKYLRNCESMPNDNIAYNDEKSFPKEIEIYKSQKFNEQNNTVVSLLNQSQFIKMPTKITRPASLIRQGGLTLYATSLKVSDLLIRNFTVLIHLTLTSQPTKVIKGCLIKLERKNLQTT